MKLRLRLLSMVTLTGMVMTSGVGEADPLEGGMNVPRGQDGMARTLMNQDQLEGKWKQFKDELKKKWGEFTDDDLLAIEAG